MPPRATRPRIRYRPSTSAPISESVTVVSIGRQCRRRNAALAHVDRYGCSTVPPVGLADGLGVTEGEDVGDGEWSGVGVGEGRAPAPPATMPYTAATPPATTAPSPMAAYHRRGGRWYASYSG